YRAQGVGGNFQSGWFDNVKVTGGAGGDAKVGLSLNQQRGPDLAPAWPHRLPEADVLKASKDPNDLPEGEGKALVAQHCHSCRNLVRIVVNRSDKDHWSHTVTRMRTRMVTANVPDLTEQQYTTIVDYL